jgi:hypothetical protein
VDAHGQCQWSSALRATREVLRIAKYTYLRGIRSERAVDSRLKLKKGKFNLLLEDHLVEFRDEVGSLNGLLRNSFAPQPELLFSYNGHPRGMSQRAPKRRGKS